MTDRKHKHLEHKLKDLQKHYPNNVYKIDDKFNIIRVSGTIPHKTKEIKK